MWPDVALVLAAYLLGAAPHLAWLARLRHVRLNGDFHEGLWNRAGKALAVTGVLGEFAKGALPVLIGRWLGFSPVTLTIAGVAAVCGQMWPAFAMFDGEKGNSIALGMVAALAPAPALVAIIFPVIALITRTIPRLAAGRGAVIGGTYSRSLPVGMVFCFLSVPVASWLFHEPPAVIWGTAALFALIMVRRLTAGLSDDLKASRDIKGILFRRLLYDRATASWRS